MRNSRNTKRQDHLLFRGSGFSLEEICDYGRQFNPLLRKHPPTILQPLMRQPQRILQLADLPPVLPSRNPTLLPIHQPDSPTDHLPLRLQPHMRLRRTPPTLPNPQSLRRQPLRRHRPRPIKNPNRQHNPLTTSRRRPIPPQLLRLRSRTRHQERPNPYRILRGDTYLIGSCLPRWCPAPLGCGWFRLCVCCRLGRGW